MDQKELKGVIAEAFDAVMQEKLAPVVGNMVASNVKGIVEKLRAERSLFGEDRTGLSDKQKMDFVDVVRAAAFKESISAKANEALIEEQDNRGGYLVSKEVAAAILRIAASVGLVMSQATKWALKTDELGIPNYTGSALTGEYLGVDAAGSVTGLTFGQAALIAKKWQLAFVVGNDLISDASVNLADWLLALGGESLANMVDKQAFAGVGSPFVGILSHPDVTVYNLANSTTGGEDTFAKMKVMDDSSALIAQIEESMLPGAAFYMHRTVWASLRVQKGTNEYILPMAGAVSNGVLSNNPTGGAVKPMGEILGYPVFTSSHFPALSATAVSTKFLAFGNMKAVAFGDKGDLRVSQYESGAFGGKEIALADQRGIVYKHRHAVTIALPAAFAVAKTDAS